MSDDFEGALEQVHLLIMRHDLERARKLLEQVSRHLPADPGIMSLWQALEAEERRETAAQQTGLVLRGRLKLNSFYTRCFCWIASFVLIGWGGRTLASGLAHAVHPETLRGAVLLGAGVLLLGAFRWAMRGYADWEDLEDRPQPKWRTYREAQYWNENHDKHWGA